MNFERIKLVAGPVEAVFEPETAFLRYVTIGDREVLRGIYFAVRGEDWGTVPSRIVHLDHEKSPDSFRLSFDVECVQGEIDFFWRGLIAGRADGTLEFATTGTARSSFLQSRMGICVLHPIRECSGRPCWVEQADGSLTYGRFPGDIEPWKPYTNFRAISHEVQPGLMATVRFHGEVFEIEDQRNWTDASFKCYTVPPGQSEAKTIETGSAVNQSVTMTLDGGLPTGGPRHPARTTTAVLTIDPHRTVPLPAIGFEAAGHGKSLGREAIDYLKVLRPAHIRVPLRLGGAGYSKRLRTSAIDAAALRTPIEAALFASDAYEREFSTLAEEIEDTALKISTWQIHRADGLPVSSDMIAAARRTLTPRSRAAAIGAGSNQHFSQIIRGMPPMFDLDELCYPVNPQMHTFDNASLVETLEAQGWTVENARRIAWNRPVVVSPVTMIRRHRVPISFDPEGDEERRSMQSDPRQNSLFGAGWTAGSLKYLAQAGASRITFFETEGWAGLMDATSPEKRVFPMYHVFADVADYVGGSVLKSISNAPLTVDGVALQRAGRFGVILANFTTESQPARVECPGLSGQLSVRILDGDTREVATRSPETFRGRSRDVARADGGRIDLELSPHAVVYIEAEQALRV